jgi:hypothetical protein
LIFLLPLCRVTLENDPLSFLEKLGGRFIVYTGDSTLTLRGAQFRGSKSEKGLRSGIRARSCDCPLYHV